MILIREVADAPVITGISKPAGLKNPKRGGEIVEQLYVGIDVSSTKRVPDETQWGQVFQLPDAK